MYLKNKLIFSYSVIAIFLSVAIIIAYNVCDKVCVFMPNGQHSPRGAFIMLSILALIIALAMSVFFASSISAPLKLLTARTKEIAHGQYEKTITYHTGIIETDDLITSVNMLAQSLATQQNRKKQMAQDYAHEFRTPLSAIQSNLEGIIDGVFEPTNQRIESIRQEILRLSRMVNEIDKIIEVEDIHTALNKENFDLSELLQNITLSFESEAKGKNIQLNLSTQPCNIFADKDKISQVIINLLSNALKYTEKGKITIFTTCGEDFAYLSIADTGIGIDENDLPHIFDYLYRADKSRSRDTGGAGIGLTVAKSIVTAHGGVIKVESKAEKGSTFTVVLRRK